MKVISPVENKHGKIFWIRIGSAFLNKDGSTNVYLNAYPMSGKLQIRPLDDRDERSQRDRKNDYANESGDNYAAGHRRSHDRGQGDVDVVEKRQYMDDELPF